jgi:P27 family predicted phage terminase small subunit
MTKQPKPPAHLAKAGRDLWRRVQGEFQISDGGGLCLLATACEALDRMRQAQEVLAADGLTVTDRYGTKKTHPCIAIERDSRNGLLASLRALNLEIEAKELFR